MTGLTALVENSAECVRRWTYWIPWLLLIIIEKWQNDVLISEFISFLKDVFLTFKFLCWVYRSVSTHKTTLEGTLIVGRHFKKLHLVQFSHSVMSDSLRPHELQHARPPCPSPTPGVHPNLTSVESVMPSNHLILCHPLLLLPSIFPSNSVFPNESALCIRWPKYWSFSFSISPSDEHSGLISFRMDWLDLPAVQGTQESSPTPQFKGINSYALSFLYSPTLTYIHDYWKNHSLD